MSIGQLEQVSDSSIRPLAERSRWYLAQAALLQDDPTTALGHLQALADSSLGYVRQAEAQLSDIRQTLAAHGDPAGE